MTTQETMETWIAEEEAKADVDAQVLHSHFYEWLRGKRDEDTMVELSKILPTLYMEIARTRIAVEAIARFGRAE